MRILFSERKKSKNQIGLDNRFKGLKPIKTGRQTRDSEACGIPEADAALGRPCAPPRPAARSPAARRLRWHPGSRSSGLAVPTGPTGRRMRGAASEDRLATRPRLLCLHSHARGKVHGPRGWSAHAATKVVTRRGAQPGRGHGTGACGSPKQSGWAITGQPGDCQHRHSRGNAWPVAPWGGGSKANSWDHPKMGRRSGGFTASLTHWREKAGGASISGQVMGLHCR